MASVMDYLLRATGMQASSLEGHEVTMLTTQEAESRNMQVRWVSANGFAVGAPVSFSELNVFYSSWSATTNPNPPNAASTTR